jgi:hypothetical protein
VGFIIFIIVIIALLVLMVIGAGVLTVYLSSNQSKMEKTDLEHKDEILDRLFNGAPVVVVEPKDSHLPFGDLMKGAAVRGYRHAHSEGGELARTHVFEVTK